MSKWFPGSVLTGNKSGPLLVGLLIIWLSGPVFSQSSITDKIGSAQTQKPGNTRQALTLDEAVRLGLKNNRSLKISSLKPRQFYNQAQAEMSRFNPEFYTQGRTTKRQQPVASQLDASEQSTERYELGFRSLTRYGIEYDLTGRLRKVDSDNIFRFVNPSHASFLGLELSIPLLKNSGSDVVLAPYRRIKFQAKGRVLQYQATINQKIREIQVNYWNLVQAKGLLSIAKKSHQLADTIVSINTDRLAEKKIPPVELIKAQVRRSRTRETVIRRESKVEDLEDKLIDTILPSDTKSLTWNDGIKSVTNPQKWIRNFQLDVPDEKLIRRTLRIHPEVQRLTKRIKAKKQEVKTTKNENLPELNLTGSYGRRGLDGERHNSLDQLLEEDFDDWSVGLNLSYNLWKKPASHQLDRRLLELRELKLRKRNLKDKIERNVKETLRTIESKRSKVKTAKYSNKLAQRQLEAQTRRLKLGLIGTSEILDAQREYLQAEQTLLQAQIEVAVAIAKLKAQTGLSLQQYVSPSELTLEDFKE